MERDIVETLRLKGGNNAVSDWQRSFAPLFNEAADEIERLRSALTEIKEKGASYMQAVDAMLGAAERDGLLKDKSPYAHAKATSDAVKHVFGTIN